MIGRSQILRGEYRADVAGIPRYVALALALVGHVGVALAMTPMWTREPVVSAGSPPAAVLVELVSSSPLLSERPPTMSAVDNMVRADDVEAALPAPAGNAMESADASPPSGLPMQPERHEPVAQALRPVLSIKPARSRKVSGQTAQANARSELKASEQSETGVPNPVGQVVDRTFGYNSSATDIPSTWKSRLLAHLERFKRYPEAAKSRREEGVSLLSFTLSRDGRVLGFFIARSSGSDELDAAAQAMIERASPVPPIPDGVPGEAVQLVVPVRFTLRS